MREQAAVQREPHALGAAGIPRGGKVARQAGPGWLRAFSGVRPEISVETPRLPLPLLELESDEDVWSGGLELPREEVTEQAGEAEEGGGRPDAREGLRDRKEVRAAILGERVREPARLAALPAARSEAAARPMAVPAAERAAGADRSGRVAAPEILQPPSAAAPEEHVVEGSPPAHGPAVIARAGASLLSVRVSLHRGRAGGAPASGEPELRERTSIVEVEAPGGQPHKGEAAAEILVTAPYAEPIIVPMAAAAPQGAPLAVAAARGGLHESEWAPPPRPRAEHATAGRKVHIENLHITVQRPPVAPERTVAAPASIASAGSFAAMPETFAKRDFNPWHRRHSDWD
jgi:hypothetical protein